MATEMFEYEYFLPDRGETANNAGLLISFSSDIRATVMMIAKGEFGDWTGRQKDSYVVAIRKGVESEWRRFQVEVEFEWTADIYEVKNDGN